MVIEFIKSSWKDTIRCTKEAAGGLIALPYPYTVPCADGIFQELYYWDTYFINKGLLLSGLAETALANANDLLYLADTFGFVPNGSNIELLNRSQPPFLSLIVYDIYECFGDKSWLEKAYKTLKTEYSFWINRRAAAFGLSRYGGNYKESDNIKTYADMYRRRTGGEFRDIDDSALYRHSIAVFESGWDITPRWGISALDYAQVELNSLLYILEDNMAHFSEIIAPSETVLWQERKAARKNAMKKHMLKNGVYYDCNIKEDSVSDYFSAASYFPLFAGLASDSEARAAENMLHKIEFEHGIAVCEQKTADITCQWAYPNSWAPITYITVKGLLNYGLTESAARIAGKYINSVDKIYAGTSCLWEKYNAVTGNTDAASEYGTPPMLGWTAGVYLALKEISGQT